MKLMTYVLAVFLFFSFEVYSQVQVQKPRCEYQESPLDLDIKKPRFSWQIQSDLYNVKQIAYQIMVATSLEKLKSEKDLSWNSNKIENNKSVFIPYGGTELKPYQTYYWKVKVWTNKGESAFSSPQSWTMSFLDTLDWKAKWIGLDAFTNKGEQLDTVINTRLAARYLRKEFEVKTPVKKAKIYISGLGLYECYINGKKISNDIFAPTASDYDKHVYYNVYDVTTFLKQKNNTIGVILGNGRYFSIRMMKEDMRSGCLKVEHYGLPKLLLQLEITDEKGEKTMVCSDTTWKLTAKGPIIANNEFDGEEYDARLELPRWTENGFNDKQWTSAHEVDAPKGKITAQPNPNIVSMQEISPIYGRLFHCTFCLILKSPKKPIK